MAFVDETVLEMLGGGLLTGTTNPQTWLKSKITIDTGDYDGVSNTYFEIIGDTNFAANQAVDLYNVTTSAVISTVNITASTASPTIFRGTTFNLTSGANVYAVRAAGHATSVGHIWAARVVIQQSGATKCRKQYPLTSYTYNSSSDTDVSSIAPQDTLGATTYGQTNADRYAHFLKNVAWMRDIKSGSPWSLEAVLSSTSSNGVPKCGLHTTGGTLVTGAETPDVTGTAVTTQSVDFSNSATNFSDEGEFEAKIKDKNNASRTARIHRSALYCRFYNANGLSRGYSLRQIGLNKTTGTTAYQDSQHRSLYDSGKFTSPFVYLESTGFCADNTARLHARDSSATSGTAGTNLNPGVNYGSGTASVRARSAAITPTNGYYELTGSDASTNGLVVVMAFLLIINDGPINLVTSSSGSSLVATDATLNKSGGGASKSLVPTSSASSVVSSSSVLKNQHKVLTTVSASSLVSSTSALKNGHLASTTSTASSVVAAAAALLRNRKATITSAASSLVAGSTILLRRMIVGTTQSSSSLVSSASTLGKASTKPLAPTTSSSSLVSSSSPMLRVRKLIPDTSSSSLVSSLSAMLRSRNLATTLSASSLVSSLSALFRQRKATTTTSSSSLVSANSIILRQRKVTTTAAASSVTASASALLRRRSVTTTTSSSSLISSSSLMNKQGAVVLSPVAAASSFSTSSLTTYRSRRMVTVSSTASLVASPSTMLRQRKMTTTSSSSSMVTSPTTLSFRETITTLTASSSLVASNATMQRSRKLLAVSSSSRLVASNVRLSKGGVGTAFKVYHDGSWQVVSVGVYKL